jgi:hypothetical protein
MENVSGAPVPGVNPPDQPILRSFSTNQNQNGATKKPLMPLIAIVLAVVFAGIATGWAIAKVESPSSSTNKEVAAGDANLADKEVGIDDESMFEEDTPEGVLKEGGLEGEGTHHLDRGAGPDKMVYLTSSVINLDNFVGKKVRVWGNTVAAQQAPWLMDVGKIKIIE